MLVILGFAFFVIMVMIVFLHAFDQFLFPGRVPENLQEVQDNPVRICRLPKRFFHPRIGFAADIDEHIAG